MRVEKEVWKASVSASVSCHWHHTELIMHRKESMARTRPQARSICVPKNQKLIRQLAWKVIPLMLGIGKQELVLSDVVFVQAVSWNCIPSKINAPEVTKSQGPVVVWSCQNPPDA